MEFVQSVIGRMAGNSFVLKGWSVTLASALFALAAKDSNPHLALLAIIPASAFWGLDAYYLRQERLFRRLHESLARQASRGEARVEPFSMATTTYEPTCPSWFRTLFSRSIVGLHGIVLASAVIVMFLLGQ